VIGAAAEGEKIGDQAYNPTDDADIRPGLFQAAALLDMQFQLAVHLGWASSGVQ
jgi:hypothetical protein